MSANEFMDREEPNLGKGSGFPQSEEIRQMLQGVAGLIADADRRQGDALRELKERLESLGRAAQSAKSRVPDEFADAFTRIEDGLALLADRIAEAETERSVARATHDDVDAFGPLLPAMTAAAAGVEASLDEAPAVAPHDTEPTANSDGYASASDGPAPLRSALSTSTDSDTPSFRQPKLAPSIIDPFDVVDSTRPGDADNPWDETSAEALTKVYETEALATSFGAGGTVADDEAGASDQVATVETSPSEDDPVAEDATVATEAVDTAIATDAEADLEASPPEPEPIETATGMAGEAAKLDVERE